MNPQDLTQTLVEAFGALADDVQSLIDRKTILEHKLRFAHEQVCPVRCEQLRCVLAPVPSVSLPAFFPLGFQDEYH